MKLLQHNQQYWFSFLKTTYQNSDKIKATDPHNKKDIFVSLYIYGLCADRNKPQKTSSCNHSWFYKFTCKAFESLLMENTKAKWHFSGLDIWKFRFSRTCLISLYWGDLTIVWIGRRRVSVIWNCHSNTDEPFFVFINAAVNGHLEFPLLNDRQRFEAVSTSNLEVYKFRDWWILTYFIFGHGESSLTNIWSMVNLERTYVLLFYYFLCLKANLDLEKKNKSAWWIFTQLHFRGGESWPNYFGKEVNWWWILT